MNGGSALNYLLLGFFNIIWIPTAMKLGRKIVYILSLVILLGGSVWGGFYHGILHYAGDSRYWHGGLSGFDSIDGGWKITVAMKTS